MNTPDTEWNEAKIKDLIETDLDADAHGKWFRAPNYEIIQDVAELLAPRITKLLSSRDTYWKERVDAEIADAVDLTKREIKHRVERYFKDAYLALKQQGGVHIHLEEIQEIIDDSTPPGFAPTPLQDK